VFILAYPFNVPRCIASLSNCRQPTGGEAIFMHPLRVASYTYLMFLTLLTKFDVDPIYGDALLQIRLTFQVLKINANVT
jgi:hypothetical protein